MDYGTAAEVTARLEERLVDSLDSSVEDVPRRRVLGGLGLLGAAGMTGLASAGGSHGHGGQASGSYGDQSHGGGDDDHEHGNFGAVGGYENANFDPHEFLRTFNTCRDGQDNVPQRVYEEDGQTVREFELTATDTTITIAPGIEFPAWTYNGQVPGPTIRAVEGDLIRISAWREGREAASGGPASEGPASEGPASDGPASDGAAGEGAAKGLWIAYLVAVGIGLHNLAEGLAIGSSFALGRVSLGAFLIVGFMLHNVTEGPAVVAPVARSERPALGHFAAMGAIAGLPVVLGGWIGGLAYSPTIGALFLAVGVGAILQVVWELRGMVSRAGRVGTALNILAFAAGVAIMYATDLAIAV